MIKMFLISFIFMSFLYSDLIKANIFDEEKFLEEKKRHGLSEIAKEIVGSKLNPNCKDLNTKSNYDIPIPVS